MALLVCKTTRESIGPAGQALSVPEVLIIKEEPDGIFLFRYQADGTFRGDTWHMSVEDAKDQATAEYCSDDLRWVEHDSSDRPEAVARAVSG